LLIKYIKSVLWRVAKRLSYKQDAWCLKVNVIIPTMSKGEYLQCLTVSFLRSQQFHSYSKLPEFYEDRVFTTVSQLPTACTFLEQAQSNSHTPISWTSILILSVLAYRFSSWSQCLIFTHQNPVYISPLSQNATFPLLHFILLRLIK